MHVVVFSDQVGPDTQSGQCLGSRPSYRAPLIGHILSEGGERGGSSYRGRWEAGGQRSGPLSQVSKVAGGRGRGVTVGSSTLVRAAVFLWIAVMASAIKH